MIPISLAAVPTVPGRRWRCSRGAPGAAHPLAEGDLVGDVRDALWVLMGTIGIVLLIACANVANLLLVRAESRQQELGDQGGARRRLGPDRPRAADGEPDAGVLGGVVGARRSRSPRVRLLVFLAPGNLPRLQDITLDLPVLLFALGMSLLSGCSSAPSRRSSRRAPSSATTLRAGGRTASHSQERSAPATCSSSRRSRWRWCCWSAPG